MSGERSYSKRSLSQTTDDQTVKKSFDKEYCSDKGSLRKKPIRKPKFLSRRQIMFQYMEKVDRINAKLKTIKKAKQMRRQIYSVGESEPRSSSLLQAKNALELIGLKNQYKAQDHGMEGLLNEFYELIAKA